MQTKEILNKSFSDDLNSIMITNYKRDKAVSGDLFFASDYDSDVDSGSTKDWVIETPSDNSYDLCYSIEASRNGTLQLYEDVTTSSAGTSLSMYNFNRQESDSIDITFYKDSTFSDTGTLLISDVIGTDGTNAAGAGVIGGGKIVGCLGKTLKQGKKYLIRFTPENDNTRISLNIEIIKRLTG
jgi:hypothetical protein